MKSRTWITTRREGTWTIFEEKSLADPPRELLRVEIPPGTTAEDLRRFGEHLVQEAKRGTPLC